MGKKSWVQYNRTGDIIEIVVRDCSGKRLDKFVFNGSDSKRFGRVMKILKDVYNFKPEVSHKESINELEKER